MHWIQIETSDGTRHFLNLERVSMAQFAHRSCTLHADGCAMSLSEDFAEALEDRLRGYLFPPDPFSDDDEAERDPDPSYEETA